MLEQGHATKAMALLARNLAPLLVRILFSEAEDPKSFLRRMSAKKAAEPGQARRKQNLVSPCEEWDEWEDLEDMLRGAALAMEQEMNTHFKLINRDDWSITIGTRDHEYYRVFKDEDAATEAAKAQVTEDLENEPGLFTQDWLESFINMERLRSELYQDARDDDYWNENNPDYDSKIQELIDRDYLDEDPRIDSDGNELEITPEIEALVDEKWEEMIESFAQSRLEDPIHDFLEDIYGHEDAVKKAIELAGIDYERAAESAVNTDGWQHFLSRDDGNSYDLPGGFVYVKE